MEQRFAVRSSVPLGPSIQRLVIDAPRVAASARAGQFVIVRSDEHAERIPLTIAEADPTTGTITLVVQAVGRSSAQIVALAEGDHFADVLGPLGTPTHIASYGRCIVVAGGVGAAIAMPVASALAAAGNTVIAVLGGRTAEHLILVDEFTDVCASVVTTTEDGSAGRRGLVTDALADLLQSGADLVFVVGPIPMMQAIAAMTRESAIPTVASLNPLMVDGTGMCGGCRVHVGGATRFACVDGPEFDAHLVDFDALARRNQAYRDFERCQADLVSPGGPS